MKKFFAFDKSLFKITTSVGTLSLFSLAFPMLFELIMNNMQGTVNTAVLSHYSEISVAAVGAVNTIISVALLLGSVIAMGATVAVSNYLGAEDVKKAREISFVSIIVCVGLAVIATPILYFLSENILGWLNLEGEIFREAKVYYEIRMCFLILNMSVSAYLALLKCYGFPKYTFFIGLLTNIINLALNVYVVYFPQYAPITGVAGVAWSCVVANAVGLLVTMIIFRKVKIRLEVPDSIRSFIDSAKCVMRIGLPAGLSSATFTISQMVITAFVALIGDVALSAKVYFLTILNYAYLFSASAGNANALIVGRCYGAGDIDRADRMNRQLINITRVVNLVVSLSILIFRRQLLNIFTTDEMIISMALGVFAVDILTEQARAVSQVYEYALRAAGDVVFSVVVVVISCWVCSIGLAYFLAIPCGLGLVGCWIGLALDEWVRAIATYLRWKSGKWIKKGGLANEQL